MTTSAAATGTVPGTITYTPAQLEELSSLGTFDVHAKEELARWQSFAAQPEERGRSFGDRLGEVLDDMREGFSRVRNSGKRPTAL